MDGEQIKKTLMTPGWAEIEKILREETGNSDFKTDGKDFKTIAVETIAREKATETIERALKRILSFKNEVKKSESYK